MKQSLIAGLMTAIVCLGGAVHVQARQDYNKMPLKELIDTAPSQHPAALYVLAARLMGQGRQREAAGWMYAGQLRYRFMLMATNAGASSNDGALFSSLTQQVGRPVNEYIAGNADEWIAAIDWALEWDKKSDNLTTSKTEHANHLEAVRQGLVKLQQQIGEQREKIARQREKNGLENR